MPFQSKLPDVGTTIFSVMSRRAQELGALDIGQGFPDFEVDPRLAELAAQACCQGYDQFAPMEGVDALREEIARSLCFGARVDPAAEITITASATAGCSPSFMQSCGPATKSYCSIRPTIRTNQR